MENDNIKITKIRPEAHACSRLFEFCLNSDALPTDIRQQINLQYERFHLWSSYLGVFAREKASLDKKLEFCDAVRDLIIRLLRLMRENLEFVTNSHVPQSILEASDIIIRDSDRELQGTSEEALSAVKTVITRLNMLSSTIQRSSAASIESRVTAFTEKHGDLNYTSLARTMIDFRYRTAPPSLKEQLATSMTYRRQRLRWTHRHQTKIEAQSWNERSKSSGVVGMRRGGSPRPQTSGRAALIMSTQHTAHDTQTVERPQEAAVNKRNFRTGITLSDTTAPSFRPNQSTILRMRIAGSVVSSTHSTTLMAEDTTGYPELPEKQEGVPHPICHYCRQPLQETDLRHWRRHVDQDLEPFVCLSDECNGVSFNNVEIWAKHMRETHSNRWPQLIHRPVIWRCEVDHPEAPFQCEDEFLFNQHLDEKHDKCSLEFRQSIAKTGQVRRKRSRNVCPLCNYDTSAHKPDEQKAATTSEVTGESMKNEYFEDLDRLAKHVANHLRLLAFDSAKDLDAQPEDGDSQGDALSVSNGQQRAGSGQHKLSGLEHISRGSLRLSDNGPLPFGAETDQGRIDEDWNTSEISALLETPDDIRPPIDWEYVKPVEENDDEDKILTSLIERRAHYGMLLQTAWQEIANNDYFQLHDKASEAITRILNKLNAMQPDPKSEKFRSDLYRVVERSDLEPFFDKLLEVLGSVDDLQLLAEYCVNQVLGGRRHLFIILLVHDSPADVLNFIKDGVADTDLPLSPENVTYYFPSWTEEEVNAFLQYQHNLPNSHEIDDQSIVDQTEDEDFFESPSKPVNEEILHEYTEHLRKKLVESVSNPGSSNNFISNSSLRRIVNQDEIRRILKCRAATSKLDTMSLLDFVCKEAVRIFAILIGLRMIDSIDDFCVHRFTDEVLPIYKSNGEFTTIAVDRTNSDIISAVFKGSHWTPGLQRSFCEHAQWLFLAPNFPPERFRYWFSRRTPLPFLNFTEPVDGLFDRVQSCSIDQSHIKVLQEFPLDSSGNVCVTLKVIKKPRTTSKSEFEAAIEAEIDVLEITRDWGNPHIIRAVAYYIRNTAHHFVFPRATGGSLRELWTNDPPKTIDGSYLQWLFRQLCGLAGAIKIIHSHSTKVASANLNPDSILCFGEPKTPWLVMSGLGLQGFHDMFLEVNNEGLANQKTTLLYEPPSKTGDLEARDIWSLGWMSLEFLTWLLRGSSELWRFRRIAMSKLDKNKSYIPSYPEDLDAHDAHSYGPGYGSQDIASSPSSELEAEDVYRQRELSEDWDLLDTDGYGYGYSISQDGASSPQSTSRQSELSSWERFGGDAARVPTLVRQWTDTIGEDRRCATDAALGKLLGLITDKLLVTDEPRRARAVEVQNDLKQIIDAATGDQPTMRWIGPESRDQK